MINIETKILRPLKAIRAKCLDCCYDNANYVRACDILDCSLWPYRFGKRPETLMQQGKWLTAEDVSRMNLDEDNEEDEVEKR